MRRAPLLLLLALAAASLAPTCGLPGVIASVSPSPGDVVSTFEFDVVVELGSEADPASLEATLNGVPIALTGGPTVFTAHVVPGPPLLDKNKLRISAERTDGVRFRRQVPFFYLPPKARAHRITRESELLSGPLAHGQIGDFLLENAQARYVVQDAPRRDLHSVGQYGGNLIDAEYDGRTGLESFFEIQPMLNIESVVNAQIVEVVNDGQDGTAAVIRACGPDDLLDYVNASSQVQSLGATVPPGIDDQDYDIEGCTEYRLDPVERWVEMETFVTNLGATPVSLYVGDYLNGMGTLEQWTKTDGAPAAGLGEFLATARTRLISYFGFRNAEGVDYSLVPIEFAGSPLDSTSFTTSGVSVLIHSHSVVFILGFGTGPLFDVPAASTRSFVRYFGVGDGSAANGVEMEAAVRGLDTGTVRGCVTVAGAPAPSARVAVGPMAGSTLSTLSNHFVTGADGCYEGRMPPGDYGIAAAREGTPFEGGGPTPVVSPIHVAAGGVTVHDVDLPATGRLRVAVTDEWGAPMPARITVVGSDPSPEPLIVSTGLSLNDTVTSLFTDVSRDRLPAGVTAMVYTGADGIAELDVEPGTYVVAASRGTEYSLFTKSVTIAAGGPPAQVAAQLAHVLDTTGFISSDYHVHMVNSPDSRIALEDRVRSFAGEGVDNLIATDHDAHTDLTPVIASLGLTPFLHSTIGEEITTFDYGHYNAYPQRVDPMKPSGGATDWAGAAPAGQDFPSFGNYVLTPGEIRAAAIGNPLNAGLDTVVQINHIDSHFGPLKIDTGLTPPQSVLGPGEPEIFRLDPSVPNYFAPFDALELWNGYTRSHALTEFLAERIGIWMNLLNQGILHTAIADTDTHTFLNLRTAGARTWTPSASDDPPAIDDNAIGRAVREGKAVGGQGLYVQARLRSASGDVADLTATGSTLLRTGGGAVPAAVDLEVDAQAPIWAPYDTIEIYVNAATRVAGTNGGVPVLYGAVPTLVLHAGTDFSVDVVDVAPGIPGAQRLESHLVQPLSLPEDAWVVVVVRGSDGVSPPMFPVFPSDTDLSENPTLVDLATPDPTENGVRALGFTNALFVDVDGNGTFDAPGVRIAP